jgi:integrase
MAPKKVKSESDRHLIIRGGIYHYKRRVPASFADLDERAPHVRVSLKTSDLALARQKRDAIEDADDRYWSSLLMGDPVDVAKQRYKLATRRVEAMGFGYQLVERLISARDFDEIAQRLALVDDRTSTETISAVLGTIEEPEVKISEAFKIYTDEIVLDEIRYKSDAQKKTWKKVKQRAVNNFTEIVGDIPITKVTRADARKLYQHWLDRLVSSGQAKREASSGNRDLGNMRVMFDAYFRHMGVENYVNPFARLSFKDARTRTRSPIPLAIVTDKLLKAGNLDGLNEEARGILLAMIETGARPSELSNLTSDRILTDAEVPHIRIAPSADPGDPYEIKTMSSVRTIPLIGVALAVFEKFKDGFPRYKGKSATVTINKYLVENKIWTSDDHTLYGLRHLFEDRMKEANIDEELRKGLMGHTINRPKYGTGGGMKWQHDQMSRITLPFDPLIV